MPNDLKKWSNSQLIEYIGNKTIKLCWEKLDNVVEELEKRIKLIGEYYGQNIS